MRPSDRPSRNDLVVLLRKPNGNICVVVVKTYGGKEIVLHSAYAGEHIDSPGEMRPITYGADSAQREFSSVTVVMPGRPAPFLLYFLGGKDELTPNYEGEIERVFGGIAASPYLEILVIGHTDAVGNAEFNDSLSRQRAQRARDDLIKRGIAVDHTAVLSRGKREPLVPTPEGVSEPSNRRVDINVR